jgi:cysteinyl-tRNA synthetase
MDDDFNSPMLISKLFEMVPRINAAAEGKEGFSAAELDVLRTSFKALLFDVLGLEEPRSGDSARVTDALVQLIIELRNEARKGKDFATSDRLRDALAAAGVILKDGKDGTTYTVQ